MLDQPLVSAKMIAEKDGAIGRIIFNNPARHNAVSPDRWEAIPVILDRFQQDPAVRMIVLARASDQAFASGPDISQFEKVRSSRESNPHLTKSAVRPAGG